jgi:poly(A) polymerase Pap1
MIIIKTKRRYSISAKKSSDFFVRYKIFIKKTYMKNLQEQINKIKGLMKSINEEDYGIPDDNYNDDDTSMDANRDEDAERVFMGAMDEIKEIYGGNMDREAYIEMIDKYLGTDTGEDMEDEEDLPFR